MNFQNVWYWQQANYVSFLLRSSRFVRWIVRQHYLFKRRVGEKNISDFSRIVFTMPILADLKLAFFFANCHEHVKLSGVSRGVIQFCVVQPTYAVRKRKNWPHLKNKTKKLQPVFGELAFDEYLFESNDFRTRARSSLQNLLLIYSWSL